MFNLASDIGEAKGLLPTCNFDATRLRDLLSAWEQEVRPALVASPRVCLAVPACLAYSGGNAAQIVDVRFVISLRWAGRAAAFGDLSVEQCDQFTHLRRVICGQVRRLAGIG